ncbi:MAG: cytochrome bc complex cytochrome b subunit [Ardenticatenaceae bacterium]|nr:cytochrome bc complex cytochrome b subunit [Ardenticatenaceae bacterium]
MSRPNFFEHLHPPTIPAREARFRYTFGLGGMSLLLFLSLIVTGVPLMFVYVPTAVSAADSIRTITYVAPYGWLLRNLHYWAAVLLLLTGSLHLLRIVFSGSYKKPRRFNWLLGLAILLLSLLLSFSGYVLRWDVDTYGALTVGTHIVRQFPVVGDWFYRLLVGGTEIGDATLVRFYTWHILGLVVPVLLLVGWHAFRVRRDGGISHRAANATAGKAPRIPRRELVQREGIAALAVLLVLFTLSLFWNAPLAPPVDPLAGPLAEPAQIAAPWFFLWIQALLRYWPPLLAGILIPLCVVGILALLPWVLDRQTEGTAVWFHPSGRWAQLVVGAIAAGIIILTIVEWRQ